MDKTYHGAHKGEHMLEVDAKDGGLSDTQVAREAGGDVDLLGVLVPPLEHSHGKFFHFFSLLSGIPGQQ